MYWNANNRSAVLCSRLRGLYLAAGSFRIGTTCFGTLARWPTESTARSNSSSSPSTACSRSTTEPSNSLMPRSSGSPSVRPSALQVTSGRSGGAR